VPYHKLVQQIEEDENARAAERLQAELDKEEQMASMRRKGKTVDPGRKVMWVDKYRPTKFTDLLGEEVSSCPNLKRII
jgi:hypothetical protein